MDGMTHAPQVLRTEFEHSEQVEKLFAALSKAQQKGLGASENANNPAFKSRYADLASVASVFRDKVAPEGFCFIQVPSIADKQVSVKTVLGHDSGQWVACTVTAMAQSTGPQHIGSAITYGKRYGLSAICGIVEGDDDDGNAAQGSQGQQRRELPPPPRRSTAPVTDMQDEAHRIEQRKAEAKAGAPSETLPIATLDGKTHQIGEGKNGEPAERVWVGAWERAIGYCTSAEDVRRLGDLNREHLAGTEGRHAGAVAHIRDKLAEKMGAFGSAKREMAGAQ